VEEGKTTHTYAKRHMTTHAAVWNMVRSLFCHDRPVSTLSCRSLSTKEPYKRDCILQMRGSLFCHDRPVSILSCRSLSTKEPYPIKETFFKKYSVIYSSKEEEPVLSRETYLDMGWLRLVGSFKC